MDCLDEAGPMKVRSPTVLLAKLQYRQAFGKSRDWHFPPEANSAGSSLLSKVSVNPRICYPGAAG